MTTRATAFYLQGDALRSRSVSDVVLSGTVNILAPPTRLIADWDREISHHLALEPGDVEVLPLARARMRWPNYQHCLDAALQWAHGMGIGHALAGSAPALMACRGARYHHDGDQYGGKAFCNLFLSEDKGLDVHFPATGHRIPLARGTFLVFDTCQPHGVIDRQCKGFNPDNFAAPRDSSQVFLTWELPMDDASIRQLLNIDFDVNPSAAIALDQPQLWWGGAKADVCPSSGQWLQATRE
jgi:hypothetical protein